MVIQRGEIWWADLGEPRGSRPGYRRPVLVVQNDAFNRSRINTIIVAGITSQLRLLDASGNVLLPSRATGLRRDSVLNVSQLWTVTREDFLERIGRVPNEIMVDVAAGLRLAMALG